MAIEEQFEDNGEDDLKLLLVEEELKAKRAHLEALVRERNRRFPELVKGGSNGTSN